MYNDRPAYQGGRRQGGAPGRSPQGGRSFGGGRSTGGRPHGGNFRPQGNRGPRPIKTMDVNRLINREPVAEVEEVYTPTHTFADFQLHNVLQRAIDAYGYTTPTPIQDQVIKPIIEGKDVVGIANTGTGKTAAFLLPILHLMLSQPHMKALIIAPTRELAQQIADDVNRFTRGSELKMAICIGGVSIGNQKRALYARPRIVVGTPGRLLDLNKQRVLDFSIFNCIVLDEVDRMLDMGFVRDVKAIVSQLAPKRQSLFFSATMTPEIESVMREFSHDPIKISVKTRETAQSILQDVVYLKGRNKIDVLHDMLISPGFEKVLIFGRTKWGIEKLATELRNRGFTAEALHGNKTQNQRQKALDTFKSHKAQILLATDIASRGLDIPNVTHVINFDLPTTYEDYVHRIGRTGRADKKGIALSFVD